MKLHRSINTSAPRRLLLQDHAPAAVNASRASDTNSTSSSSKVTAIPPPNNPYYPKNHNSSSDTSPDSSANTDAVRFDSSSVAVTALVILSALFFLGFFSVYARRFFAPEWDSSETPASRRRRLARRGRIPGASGRGGAYPHGAPRGLDPDAIKALPLIRYSAPADVVKGTMGSKDVARKEGSAGADEEMEDGDIHRCCAVCLGEFEEGEELRAIPGCGHAFHKDCIDAWLAAHGSCPLCRTTDLFGTAKQQGKIDPAAVLAQGQRVTCDVCRLESVVVVRPVDEGAGSGQEEGGGGQRRLDRDVDNGHRQPAAATATAPMASPEACGVGGMGRSRSWLCMSAAASEAADEEKGPPPPASVVREEQPQPPRRSYS